MRDDLNRRVERHLDRELGIWTRVLPWRGELVTHLEEACLARGDGDKAFDAAIADFGNVQDVADRLKKEHLSAYWALRFLVIVTAALVVCLEISPHALFDWPSLTLVLVPAGLFAIADTLGGSTRWDAVGRVGGYVTLAGALLGAIGITLEPGNPSWLGACMALSLISALYGVLLFTPGRWISMSLVGIGLGDFALMAVSMIEASRMSHGLTYAGFFGIDWAHAPDLAGVGFVFAAAVSAASLASFGPQGAGRRAASMGVATFLLVTIKMLGDMSDPKVVSTGVLVALVAGGFTVACCRLASDASPRLGRAMAE